MPDPQGTELLALPGLVLALTGHIHLKDGEEASTKLGHSDERNSQSQTIGFCQQKDLADGCFVFMPVQDDAFSRQSLLGLTGESLPCS